MDLLFIFTYNNYYSIGYPFNISGLMPNHTLNHAYYKLCNKYKITKQLNHKNSNATIQSGFYLYSPLFLSRIDVSGFKVQNM